MLDTPQRTDGRAADIQPHPPLAAANTSAKRSAATDASKRILAGQKALVIGASSDIGQAVALALGEAVADVVVNYVTGDDRAEEVAAQIRSAGIQALAHRADVSNEQQVQEMFRRAIDELGTIDILINNAGLQRDAPFHAMTSSSGTPLSASI